MVQSPEDVRGDTNQVALHLHPFSVRSNSQLVLIVVVVPVSAVVVVVVDAVLVNVVLVNVVPVTVVFVAVVVVVVVVEVVSTHWVSRWEVARWTVPAGQLEQVRSAFLVSSLIYSSDLQVGWSLHCLSV